MKTKLLVLLSILFFAVSADAQQKNHYSFSQTSGNAYAELTGDINVSQSFNSLGLYNIPVMTGETLRFFDLDFPMGGLKTIAVGENPFLRVDNDTSLVIVDAAFTYADSIDPTSKISYLVQGVSGDKIVKTQYKNLMLRYGQAGNFINVQIWYYQQTGVIEIHYGPRSPNNASGHNTSQGPQIGIFYSPDSFTGCYEKLWCTGSPGNVILDSAANYVFKAMSGVPDNGTVYKFSPRMEPPSTVFLREEVKPYEMSVAPNPAYDKIKISLEQGLNGKVSIRNILGSTLGEAVVSDKKSVEMSVEGLNPGVYFITFKANDGTLVERKFLVE